MVAERSYAALCRFDLEGLALGNARQQAAAACLESLGILTALATFTPVVAGTIPIDIDLPSSDIDILCQARELKAFSSCVQQRFGSCSYFRTWTGSVRGVRAHVAAFKHADFEIEIFAQPIPVQEQYGYRHMIAEARLLTGYGAPLRDAVRALKRRGVKTEPAFAMLLGMDGDPYEAVAAIHDLDDAELAAFVAAHALTPA
jgi:hypothetical protein